MQALFLVFLSAACLNELVLAVGLARNAGARRASLSLGLATGVAVLLPALLATSGWPVSALQVNAAPPRLLHFLFAFCFLCVLMQLASGRAQPTPLKAASQQWRVALPLLSGSLAVLVHAIANGPPRPIAMLAASIGLAIALAVLTPVAMAVLDRLQVSLLPAPMRGTPIVILCAALAAIGLMGLAPGLPW